MTGKTLMEELVALTIDYDGTPMPDGAETLTTVSCGQIRAIAEYVRQLEQERDELRRAAEWQPIETAPKDGSAFLGICPDERYPQAMHWEAYSESDAEEVGEAGYWTYSEDLISDVAGEARPTHWMPLPPAPSALNASNREGGE